MKNIFIACLTMIFCSQTSQAQTQWSFYSTVENYPDVESNEITLLPDDVFNASSTALLRNKVPAAFILSFEYNTCDEDGAKNAIWNSADGIAVGLGQKKNDYTRQYVNAPEQLTGAYRGSVKQFNGVSIQFATYGAKGSNPLRNQGVFVLGRNNQLLAADSSISTYTDCQWQNVRISLSPKKILRIYKDAKVIELKLTRNQVRQIKKGFITFSAASGAADSEHAIKDIRLIRYQDAVHRFKSAFNQYNMRLTDKGIIVSHKKSKVQKLVKLTQEAVLAFKDTVIALPSIQDLALENISISDPEKLCKFLSEIDSNQNEIDLRDWYDDAQSLMFDLSTSMVLIRNKRSNWQSWGTISTNMIPTMEYVVDHLPRLSTFEIHSINGSNDDVSNYRALRLMRKHGINTELVDNGEINSGGVNFFLAGKVSTLSENPTVGVHPWTTFDQQATENGGCILVSKSALDFPSNDPSHQTEISFLKEIGIDESFYWFTLNAKPNTDDEDNDIHVMTQTELEQFGFYKK